jgi:hypothetical protein
VKKSCAWLLTMRLETPAENWRTCRWTYYRRKASEDHGPINMMVKMGTPGRCMAIAPPDRIEWVPMSRCEKASTSSPICFAAA